MSDDANDVTTRPSSTSGRAPTIALWSGFALLVAGLIYAGFIYPKTVKPDAGTLLPMAELHLGLAQAIPSNKGGEVHRADNIQKAIALLDQVEESSPGLSITAEFRAFAHWLSGEHDKARQQYARALELAETDHTVGVRIRANLASLELSEGKADRAIQQLDAIAESDRNSAIWIARAQAFQAKGDKAECRQSLKTGLSAAIQKSDPREIFAIAEAASSLDAAIATSAFERLAPENERARYRLAQLKIRGGDSDSATSMLLTIGKKSPDTLKRWVQQDHAFWSGAPKAVVDKVLATEAKPSR